MKKGCPSGQPLKNPILIRSLGVGLTLINQT